MKFFGQKRVVKVDANYSQIAELEKFWNELHEMYPGELLFGLGANMNNRTIDYYIGKVDENWMGGSSVVEIPDDGWKEFSCEEDDTEIEKLYRSIFEQGTLDYELESMQNGIFVTKVHFANKGENDEV
ncbi:MAG: hypothetical protein U0520_00730 [Candidatus Saccharimonadales bacterium]